MGSAHLFSHRLKVVVIHAAIDAFDVNGGTRSALLFSVQVESQVRSLHNSKSRLAIRGVFGFRFECRLQAN